MYISNGSFRGIYIYSYDPRPFTSPFSLRWTHGAVRDRANALTRGWFAIRGKRRAYIFSCASLRLTSDPTRRRASNAGSSSL